jgi:hypothetical protein
MVEPWIVIPVVAGSSPVIHPKKLEWGAPNTRDRGALPQAAQEEVVEASS